MIVARWMSLVDFDRNGGKSQIWRRFKRVEGEEFEFTGFFCFVCFSNFATFLTKEVRNEIITGRYYSQDIYLFKYQGRN